MSDTEPVHRCGRALSRPARRLAIAGGLVLASWALGAVLSTAVATADELPTSDTSTVADTGTTSEAKSEAKSAKSGEAEESTAEAGASEASATTEDSTSQEPAERKQKQSSTSGGGLLGGLLGTVVHTLTSTLNAVTGTVTGLVSAVNENVLAPITGGGDDGKPPPKLPIIGDLLPSPDDWSDGGQWESGGSVSITVPAKQQPQTTTVAPAAPQPEAPQPAAPVTDTPVVVSHPAPATHVSARVAAQQKAVDEPTKSDKRFGAPSGGGSGGGRGDLPPAPSAPAAPTTVSAGHDNSGGARQQNAIMASSANTTQLRLIGTSLDHEVDGAGREAALPTTSPD